MLGEMVTEAAFGSRPRVRNYKVKDEINDA
jgi:hypothetical protein